MIIDGINQPIILFTTPNQFSDGKYDRTSSFIGECNIVQKTVLVCKLFDNYGTHTSLTNFPLVNGAIPFTWNLRVFSIESGVEVDVKTGPQYVAGTPLPTSAAPLGADCHFQSGGQAVAKMTIDPATMAAGVYYCSSTLPGTLVFPFFIKKGTAVLEPSKFILLSPIFNPGAGGWPTNYKTRIVPNLGIRKSAPLKIPITPGDKFTAPLDTYNTDEVFVERLSLTNGHDYDGTPRLTTTPAGGLFSSTLQRYNWQGFDGMTPEQLRRKTNMYPTMFGDSTAADSYDGDCETSGYTGELAGAKQLSNGDWLGVSPQGALMRFDAQTRQKTTLYGWRLKEGSPEVRNASMLTNLDAREAFLMQYYDFVGDVPNAPKAPRIGRAWGFCINPTETTAYICEPLYHTVVAVDLATSQGTVIAGTPGMGGFIDGGLGVAKFDQPRGVVYIKSGTYADHLVISDEHNSAFRLLNLATGQVTTLSRALNVPIPATGFKTNGSENTQAQNRVLWGAQITVQPFASAQFCHPCGSDVLSDGKTVAVACHDVNQVLKLDLDAQTITLLRNLPDFDNKMGSFAGNWPTTHVDREAYFGPAYKDAIFTCAWHPMSVRVTTPNGASLPFYSGGRTAAGDQLGWHENGYPRLIAPGFNGALTAGSGHASCSVFRKRRSNDPAIDWTKYDAGRALYTKDGPDCAALVTQMGPQGYNYLAQFKTPGQLALLDFGSFKTYMIETFGVSHFTDAQMELVQYYISRNSVTWAKKLKEPGWDGYQVSPPPPPPPPVEEPPPPPPPVTKYTYADAVALAKTGKTVKFGELTLDPTSVAAMGWALDIDGAAQLVKNGAVAKLGEKILTKEAVLTDQWEVVT